tara:strand:- start:3079 stop:3777 length:699 start_codon:yes stop_codon:yes gene_type:complete
MFNEDKAWVDYKERFSDIYDDLNYSSGLQGFVMRSGHFSSEKKWSSSDRFNRVLEIGSGTGEHLPYIRHSFDEYILSDQNESALTIAKEKLKNFHKGKLRFEIQKGANLAYPDETFDRVIACHVLEHIYMPHLAIKEWCRVLKNEGILTILIPTDPGLAWRLGRNFGPRKNALKKGISYDYVMAREHVNSCNSLVAILRHYFPDSSESWWPFHIISSMDLNLFYIFHARIDK